jgi:hypothetical protein
MNSRKNFLTDTFIDYRILKTPLEVIKSDEHHMTYGEYKQVLYSLSRNLSMILDKFDDNLFSPEDFISIFARRDYVRYYIEADIECRQKILNNYKQKCDELTKAFFSHTVVCKISHIDNTKNIML